MLQAVSRDTPLEFELSREKAMCCGAGGGRMWLEEKIGTRINVLRAEQALARQPAAVATACPYCAVMLGDGLAQKDEHIAARDIAELVAEALPQSSGRHSPPAGRDDGALSEPRPTSINPACQGPR